MQNVLVTGATGFIGKNLLTVLQRVDELKITTCNRGSDISVLNKALLEADIIFHLAGVNRPKNKDDFARDNVEFTSYITEFLIQNNRKPKIILPSSIQAALDNPYGKSKKDAEDTVLEYRHKSGAAVALYRLPGVFGKWSQPNYNTVVATFCYNIARGIDIKISDPDHELELVYIDDVVSEFLRHLSENFAKERQCCTVSRTFRVTLSELAECIMAFHSIRESLLIPDLKDDFMKCLHATYLSFLPQNDFAYPVNMITDERGWLFEFIKSEHSGQLFISKTLPGITRGDHYHDTKLEKFCVIQGQGVVSFRHIHSDKVLEYPVDANTVKVVDIPPGYTHSIKNIGSGEMICLFWANEMFEPQKTDTYWEKVWQPQSNSKGKL